MNLWLQKRYDKKNFFTPLFCCCFWIRDPGWVKIWIRDKHPGSATLFGSTHIIFFLSSADDQHAPVPVLRAREHPGGHRPGQRHGNHPKVGNIQVTKSLMPG